MFATGPVVFRLLARTTGVLRDMVEQHKAASLPANFHDGSAPFFVRWPNRSLTASEPNLLLRSVRRWTNHHTCARTQTALTISDICLQESSGARGAGEAKPGTTKNDAIRVSKRSPAGLARVGSTALCHQSRWWRLLGDGAFPP